MRRTAKKNKGLRKKSFVFLCLCPKGHNIVTSVASTSFDSLLSTSLSEKRAQNEVALRQMKRLRLRVNFI